jgi:two-component system sensor histidine kinase KdpD
MQEILRGSFVARVTRLAGNIDVHVIASEDDTDENDQAPRRRFDPGPVEIRRKLVAWGLTAFALPALIAATLPLREHVAISTELLLVLTLVLAIAAIGGTIVGVVAAVIASLLVNWFFVPPYNTLTISEYENVIALAVFVGVAVTVGSLVVTASRRSIEAKRARIEAESLARSATSLAADPDPLPALLDNVRTTFALDGVRLVDTTANLIIVEVGHTAGTSTLAMPLNASATESGPTSLEVFGGPLSHDDQQLLRVLADQLRGREARRHRRCPNRAAALGVARPPHTTRFDQGHDLRTSRQFGLVEA